jgi:hypothetical protein
LSILKERYYVLVESTMGCQVPHRTLAEAYAEAKRLHDLSLGLARIYVLQTIGVLDTKNPQKRRAATAALQARLSTKPGGVEENGNAAGVQIP